MAGRRVALIVANDRYDHAGLRQLRSPAADAEALARVLGDTEIGGFEVEAVHNEPSHVISTRIEDFFTEGRADDVLLLHFSCHGLKSESGELFFAATGTRPDRLASTAISADFVQRCMRASRSRSIVLLLDCCYGGAFSRGVTVRAAGDVDVLDNFRGGGRGRAVITASSSMEYAFEGDRLADDHEPAPSVFTSALIEGLETGDADRDSDGWVSLNELYDYVFDKVRERNTRQTPSRDVEMQGELYVARSRRQRVKPLPIPADLRAAMGDSNLFSRMGAVTELRARLAGEDVGPAAGALEALREIAASDISYVADAATAALDDVRVRPALTEIQVGFDLVTVPLLGPPLARIVTLEVSDPRIRAVSTAEGVQISATTNGHVTLLGQVSSAVIAVHADAPAAPQATPAVKQLRTDLVLLGAGALSLLLGVLIFSAGEEQTRVRFAEAHLVLFALLWLWQAFAPGERTGPHRVNSILLGATALATVGWMLATKWYYLEAYAVVDTPLVGFWLVAGLLLLAGTAGRHAPTVPVERLAGAATAVFGLIVIVLSGHGSDNAFAVLYGYFVVLTGLLWLTEGYGRAS